MSDVL
jgi:DNA-binding HxlR family transcriptional regulator